jgi:formate/nitrite transporter FocA (FNT family)
MRQMAQTKVEGSSLNRHRTAQPASPQPPAAKKDEDVHGTKNGLTAKEQSAVVEGQRPRAPVVYEIVRREGERELRRPVSSLWWSGVTAGISIGFSFLSQTALEAYLPNAEWRHAISSLGYSTGFMMVILGRQQLFTENVLTAVLPVMTHRKLSWLVKMLRLWGVVLAANVTGALVFAYAFAFLPIANQEIGGQLTALAHKLMENTPTEMLAKGIGAGWLMGALVWIIASTEGLEFFIVGLLTYLIALLGFTHVVAGSAEVLYGWFSGVIPFREAAFTFFLPTLAGNVFGGTVLFSALSYGQVHEEMFEQKFLQRSSHP